MNQRQLCTVLAALRLYQDQYGYGRLSAEQTAELRLIASDEGALKPLKNTEIDELIAALSEATPAGDPPPTGSESHGFHVIVSGCTKEQAAEVLANRLGFDEDYGFSYQLNW